jgi:AmiR/NasT family two-component response regulator
MSQLERSSTSATRVLLADDDDAARETLAELLGALGHMVVGEVGNGRDAVSSAESLRPDVVLLDIHMPDGSGIEAAEEIARQVPGTAVVLFSGDHALMLSDDEVDSTRAIAYLPKPTPPNVLDATLRMAVARARSLRDAQEEANLAKTRLEERKTIERAKGILMRRTGSSEQEAYSILRRTSQDRSVPMLEIAKAVLESEPGYRAPGSTQ